MDAPSLDSTDQRPNQLMLLLVVTRRLVPAADVDRLKAALLQLFVVGLFAFFDRIE
jgi:hypothetical protein